MGQIVSTLMTGVSEVITIMTGAIKDAATALIWQDPTAETKVLSDVMQFGLVMAGVSIAMGIGYMVFRLIRR